jgi:membrane associated rhomboid family serine protease
LDESCWLVPAGAGCRLFVEPTALERVRIELALYGRESTDWPPVLEQDPPAQHHLDLVTPMLWAFVILLAYRGQLAHASWTRLGEMDAVAVWRHGELWRAFTALFLHGNGSHLVSNLCAGIFVFAAVLSVIGRVRGWLLIGIAGVVGNLAAAAVHYPDDYRSLGASTAIFAAVGLLTGRAVRTALRVPPSHRWRTFFLPFATGLTVLALYGSGGPEVDVLAHITGFGAGVLLGLIATAAKRATPGG